MNRFKALLLTASLVSSVTSMADWSLVSPFNTRKSLAAVTSANGLYVAGGDGLLIYSEDNGANWKAGASTPNGNIRAISYGNDRFVAVGSGSTAYYSTDGKHWMSTTLAADQGISNIAFGNGKFVATSTDGAIAYSSDGIAWTILPNAAPGGIVSIAYGNGSFVGIVKTVPSANFTVVTSADGANWTTTAVPIPSKPADYQCGQINCTPVYLARSLEFANGFFAAPIYYGDNGFTLKVKYAKSVDGLTWQWVSAEAAGQPKFALANDADLLTFVNGRYVQLWEGGLTAPQFWVSSDLLSWTGPFFPNNGPAPGGDAVAGNGTSVVAVGRNGFICSGPTLESMTALPVGGVGKVWSVASGPGGLYAAGPSGLLAKSIDSGRTWTKLTLPSGASDLNAIASGAATYFGVGAGGTVVRSTLGGALSKRLSNTSSDLTDVIYGNGIWVAVGAGGVIITSEDASTFYLQNSPTQIRLNGIGYGDGRFVVVGQDGAILNSNNATNWTIRGTDEAVTLNGVAFGSGRFVAVGENGITHWSSDLTTWHTVRINNAGRLTRVGFANGIFAAVEEGTNRVFTSLNGEGWFENSLTESVNFGLNASDGSLWVSGDNGLIWRWTTPESATLSVRGEFDAQKRFKLNIASTDSGNYRIFSKTDASGGSWIPGELISVTNQTTWVDASAAAGQRYYFLQKQ